MKINCSTCGEVEHVCPHLELALAKTTPEQLNRFTPELRGRLLALVGNQLESLGTLNLRPNMETAISQGMMLLAAEALIPHGEWLKWLRKRGWTIRTAQKRMQVARARIEHEEEKNKAKQENREPNTPFAAYFDGDKAYGPEEIVKFLGQVKEKDRQQTIRDNLAEAAERAKELPDDNAYRVVHADNRTFEWPETVDLIVTDPPWSDWQAYEWLAVFAEKHLRQGGLLFVMVDADKIGKLCRLMEDHGLTQEWLLIMTYPHTLITKTSRHPWMIKHRPTLVFAKGEVDREQLTRVSDHYSVKLAKKKHFLWQQPLLPWQYWLRCLSREGQLIADPFAGVGTFGVATKRIGKRRYLGTEQDAKRAAACKTLLAETVEGSYWTDKIASYDEKYGTDKE